jgi:hypothetical protein
MTAESGPAPGGGGRQPQHGARRFLKHFGWLLLVFGILTQGVGAVIQSKLQPYLDFANSILLTLPLTLAVAIIVFFLGTDHNLNVWGIILIIIGTLILTALVGSTGAKHIHDMVYGEQATRTYCPPPPFTPVPSEGLNPHSTITVNPYPTSIVPDPKLSPSLRCKMLQNQDPVIHAKLFDNPIKQAVAIVFAYLRVFGLAGFIKAVVSGVFFGGYAAYMLTGRKPAKQS